MKHPCRIALLALLFAGIEAQAVEYSQVDVRQSALSFNYRQMGVPMEGKFAGFAAKVSFDPANLAASRAQIDVNVASIDTGSADANDEVLGKKWFDAKAYPLASFVSGQVKPLGGNRYQALGKLTIKGRTLDIAAPVTFVQQGKFGIFEGSFDIKRLSYAIGTGEWTDVGTVADEVQIRFRLVTTASPATPSSNQPQRKKP